MKCFECVMLSRKFGLLNFCEYRNKQLSAEELEKGCIYVARKKSVARVNCCFCKQLKTTAIYLRDEAGDHPVCKECADAWADSDEEWPRCAHATT